jgi:hypothetical protein
MEYFIRNIPRGVDTNCFGLDVGDGSEEKFSAA